MTAGIVVLSATVYAQGDSPEEPTLGDRSTASNEDLRFEEIEDGRYRIQSTTTTLTDVFRRLADGAGLQFRATDDVRRLIDARVPTIDLNGVTLEELLEFLGGAYGVEAHLLDGDLSVEVQAEPVLPSGWRERKREAISILRRALLRYPRYQGGWKAYLQIGDLHFRDRMYEEAISEYRMILGMNAPREGLAAAKLSLGRAYLAANEPSRARFYLLDYTRRHPEDGRFLEAYEMIARSYLIEGDPVRATRTLSYLLQNELKPETQGRIYHLKGDAAVLAGRFDEACISYRAALAAQLDPEARVEVGLALAEAFLEGGRSAEAIAAVVEFIGESGGMATSLQQARAWVTAGIAYRDLEKPAEEFLSFHRADALAPDLYPVVSGWSRALAEAGMLEQAAEVLGRYEPEPERVADIAHRRGSLYEEMGLLEKARASYELMLEDPQRRFEGTLAMARVLEQQEEHEACLRLVDAFEEADPAEAEQMVQVAGRCLVALGRTEEAIDRFVGRQTNEIETTEGEAR